MGYQLSDSSYDDLHQSVDSLTHRTPPTTAHHPRTAQQASRKTDKERHPICAEPRDMSICMVLIYSIPRRLSNGLRQCPDSLPAPLLCATPFGVVKNRTTGQATAESPQRVRKCENMQQCLKHAADTMRDSTISAVRSSSMICRVDHRDKNWTRGCERTILTVRGVPRGPQGLPRTVLSYTSV